MIKKLAGSVLFVALVAYGASCRQDSVASNACTVILVNPKSGQQASIGREIHRALELVNAELAAAPGSKVRIEEIDTQSSPTIARAEVERAISRWNSPVVVGSILSAETREFLKPLLAKNIVVIANGSSDPTIRTLPFRRAGDGFFRNWPADDFEGVVMAEYLRSTNRAQRLVVLHANDPYATSLAKAFTRRFTQLGGVVLGPEIYPTELASFEALIRRQPLLNHDGYYVIGFPTDLAGIYNTIRRTAETKKSPMYSAVGINTGEFTDLTRYPLDALFFTAPAVDDSSGPYFKFRESYKARFKGESPDIVAAVSYDALKIAISAIDTAGCNANSIKNRLYKESPYDGASGPTGFDALGDVVTKGVAINYYERGRRLQAEVRSAKHE